LRGGINPAGVNTAVQRLGNFRIDLGTEPGQAPEGCLDVTAGTAETIINIQMPQSGINVVAPHQAHHAAAKPDAFRVSGRATDSLGRFGEFVGLALIVLGRVRRLSPVRRRFAGLILGPAVAALGESASDTDQQCKSGDGEVAQNGILKLKHPSTHKFPDFVAARDLPGRAVDAVQIGPQCGGMPGGFPMTDISVFVQQSHNFIVLW
jgi:hypothetical protein